MPHTRVELLERLLCTGSERDRSDLAEVYNLGPLLHQPAPEMEADVAGYNELRGMQWPIANGQCWIWLYSS